MKGENFPYIESYLPYGTHTTGSGYGYAIGFGQGENITTANPFFGRDSCSTEPIPGGLGYKAGQVQNNVHIGYTSIRINTNILYNVIEIINNRNNKLMEEIRWNNK